MRLETAKRQASIRLSDEEIELLKKEDDDMMKKFYPNAKFA